MQNPLSITLQANDFHQANEDLADKISTDSWPQMFPF
jgi:hypothetical protein